MQTLAGQRIFSIGQMSYVWEDVVLAGVAWGDWAALEERARDGLLCLARLEDLDEDDEDALDEDDVESAAAEFRYARDLIAASDLEAWLERRGLTVDAWLDHIRRVLLRERWAEDLEDIREEYEAEDDEVAEATLCDALCSGAAAELAGRLAGRAAIHASIPDAPSTAEALSADEELLARALPDLPGPERRRRLQALGALEATWQRFAAGVVTPEAMRALIVSRRLEWVRVVLQGVLTQDEDVAREVAACVRVDRRSIEEVAEEAGQTAERLEWWLDELDGPLHDALVGAQVGELVGPIPWKEQQLVFVVEAKQIPSEEDAAVLARAERALLARTVDREVANRVTWHETL
ncbi:MAG TPA: hypothetical protein VHT71_08380 [Methylomirabilota bacterium]|jgi:hypothetical protein|nr:hypothetical protein [Methylomirabilota bacterium]